MSDDPRDFRPLSRRNRPFWGLGIGWALAIVAVIVVLGPVGVLLDWYGTAQKVVSPANVTQQYSDAYTNFEGMKETSRNVCDQQKLVDDEKDPSVKVQLQQQLSAYQQNYTRLAGKYDAAYDNAFQAKHVGPKDLPRPAPRLAEAIKLYC